MVSFLRNMIRIKLAEAVRWVVRIVDQMKDSVNNKLLSSFKISDCEINFSPTAMGYKYAIGVPIHTGNQWIKASAYFICWLYQKF